MFNKITDYFLPPGFAGSLDLRRQARIIVNTVLVTSLFSLNFLVLCWWADFRPGMYILLFGVVSFALLPFGYRAGWYSHVVLGYAYLFIGYLTVAVNSVYQGGYYAPTTSWLALCGVTGSFLLGRRAGLIFFGLGLTTVLAFWVLEQRHYVFPSLVPADKAEFWHLDILAGLMLILLVVALVFDNINTNTLRIIGAKNALLSERTAQLEQSLTDLRAAQAQLVQHEKMASLGELTAGIAHEIQNPLNFVNNFSEVSSELLAELAEEQARPERDAALEGELVGDLQQNMRKITEHGRRAAGIVKGMLEHSSSSSAGERQPTDLNRLCDECLRLAYQALRAKDKRFNAGLTTDFLADLPPVTLAGADVGRVLLNLFTNAFYAVRQRQLHSEPGYQPQVGVRTRVLNQQVQIQVSDNGTGMSAAVQAKIFQPFFTTKPTGEGTGLGLSLAHDIVAQGHGGTLSVESQEGKGTTFSVNLPLEGTAYQPTH